MKCISCGAEVSGEVLGSLIKCDYCGTTNSYVQRVKIKVDASESNLDTSDVAKLEKALYEIDQGEFEDAYEILDEILLRNDRIPSVYANMAICVFWTGEDDFAHLPNVLKLLRKAYSIGKDSEEIELFVRAIVFNTAKIATLKNRFGSNLDNCTNALSQTVVLIPEYSDRDKLLSEFVMINTESLVRDVWVHIKRDKKTFDPPRTLVSSLVNLVALDPSANKEASALALICINQKGANFNDVSKSTITTIQERYAKIVGKKGDPKLEFPMFSVPKIIY